MHNHMEVIRFVALLEVRNALWPIPIGTIGLLLFIGFQVVMAYKAYVQGNANAWKEAREKIWNMFLGFILLIALFSGLLFVLLKYVGVRNDGEFNPLKLLELIKQSSSFYFPDLYAAGEKLLPKPLGVTSLYDFLLNITRLAISWFLYPALIVMWMWCGYSYVAAQGNPERLNKTHKWLLAAVLCTIFIFMIQGFLSAAQGTVQKILSGTKSSTESSSATRAGGGAGGGAASLMSLCPSGSTGSGGTCSKGDVFGNVLGKALKGLPSLSDLKKLNSALGHPNVTPSEQAKATSAYQNCMTKGGTEDDCATAYENSLKDSEKTSAPGTSDTNYADTADTYDSNYKQDVDTGYQDTSYDTQESNPEPETSPSSYESDIPSQDI